MMNILLLGAYGQVGIEVQALFQDTPYALIALSRQDCDLSDLERIESILMSHDIDLIINAAAYTAVDQAEDEVELAHTINCLAVEKIALFCKKRAIPLLHLSTDYVFDGTKTKPYREEDRPNPLSVYGQSKWAGEQVVAELLERFIILRTSWVFGVHRKNFVKTILNLAANRDELHVVYDQWGRPTPAKDIARVVLNLVNQMQDGYFKRSGIYHYAGKQKTNWYEFAQVIIEQAREQGMKLRLNKLHAISTEAYPTKVNRPKNSVLSTRKIERVFQLDCHSWRDYLPEVIGSMIIPI